jgi:hypothetical protein
VHVVDLQQVQGVGAEPVQGLGDDCGGVFERAVDRGLRGKEDAVESLQVCEDPADHEFGVAIGARSVDHLRAELEQPRRKSRRVGSSLDWTGIRCIACPPVGWLGGAHGERG